MKMVDLTVNVHLAFIAIFEKVKFWKLQDNLFYLSKFLFFFNSLQAGPQACIACNPGWTMESEKGCLDINECITGSPCNNHNEFCVNNDGSYTCLSKW